MSTAEKIKLVSNRVERAKSFLLSQFKDKSNINAFVDVVVSELQELENALTDLQEVRTLRGSYGPYLDEIGRRLKVERGNYADDDYKTAIKIAMAKKTSSATAEDILFIVELLTGDTEVVLTNNYPYMMELTGYLFCLADDNAGLQALADLFPVNTRVRLIQQFGKSFKFGTSGRGFGSGSTLNHLVYHRYGNTNDSRFSTVEQAIIPPALTTPPFNIILPYIVGNNQEGSVLTAISGDWGGDDPITISYQWLREGANISGATSSAYTVTSDDLGLSVACSVTATNPYGATTVITNAILIEEIPPVVNPLTSNIGIENVYASTPWSGGAAVISIASITFNNDGTTLIEENAIDTSDQYLTTTGAGLGAGYNLSYTVISGSAFPNLNPNTTYNLANPITFTTSASGAGQIIRQGTYAFTIRQVVDGSVVQTKQISVTAEIEDIFN